MQSRLVAAMAIAALSALVSLAAPASAQDPARADTSIAIRDAERAALRVQHLLASTRTHDTRERATCVDGHLSQIHSTLRLALERRRHLDDAERRGDRVRLERERALVQRLADDIRRLELQARACVDPEPPLPSGSTRVTTIIEPWVPDLDLTALPR